MIFAILTILDGLSYRLRGGGFIKFSDDTPCRLICAALFTLSYIFTHVHSLNYLYAVFFLPLAFLSFIEPHSASQQMKSVSDFFRMMLVGLLAGLTIFMPYSTCLMITQIFLHFWGNTNPSVSLSDILTLNYNYWRIALCVGICAIGDPLAYVLGWRTPITIGSSLNKNSTEWAELYVGIIRGIAISVL